MSESLDMDMREHGTTMRRVPEEEIDRYFGGDELISALSFLEMGCFDAGDHYEIGLLQADFPVHDRWFYRVDKQDAIARGWRLATLKEYGACSETYSTETEEDVVFEITELQVWISRVVRDTVPEGAEWETISKLQHAALSAWRAFGRRGLEPHHLRLAWTQDLHDLIRHPQVWQAAHPEATGLPRDLVLRMYSLRSYADSLAAGVDWAHRA